MKDIFIDSNLIKNFTNPMDIEYIKLIEWLKKNNERDKSKNAYLVTSKKLIIEYFNTCREAYSDTCIYVIIDLLQKQDRLNPFSTDEINEFKRKHFKKHILNNLRSNYKDKMYFLPLIMMSDRKYALVIDDNFYLDINNFPGFRARAEKRPEKLPYDK